MVGSSCVLLVMEFDYRRLDSGAGGGEMMRKGALKRLGLRVETWIFGEENGRAYHLVGG